MGGGTGFEYLAQAGVRNAERQQELEDEQRKATLKTLQEDATTPADKVAAIQAVYHKDPSVLKQHVENLTRRITGKTPQPVVNPQQAQAGRVADLTARGQTPEQQTLTNAQRTAQFLQKLPPDERRAAEQILGVRMTSRLQNFRNAKTGETVTWDTANGETPGPDWILAGNTVPKTTADEAKRSDYEALAAAGKLPKDAQGNPLSYEGWVAQATAAGRVAGSPKKGLAFDPNTGQVRDLDTGKRYSRADQNLPPEVATMFTSQKETAAEKQQNAMKLAYARGDAYAGSRVIQVLDPTDPSSVSFMRARDAVAQGAHSPAGIAFQTDKAFEKFVTSGQGGQNIIAFNTASAHLNLLQQAADALKNGDVQAANRIANAFAASTGNPAPTNFAAVKAAVAGEIATTFKKGGATDTEIEQVTSTIDAAQSPEQIAGAIRYYRALMQSKVQAVEEMHGSVQRGLGPAPKKAQPKSGAADPLGVL